MGREGTWGERGGAELLTVETHSLCLRDMRGRVDAGPWRAEEKGCSLDSGVAFSARGRAAWWRVFFGQAVVLDGSEVGRAAMDVPGLLREI